MSGRVIVVGDSLVRGTDSSHISRMARCLIGAIKNLSEWLHGILNREGKQPDVVVHVGINDMCVRRDA